MAMPSSQTMNYSQLCDDIVKAIWMRSQSEMVPELRPVLMPVDLFKAAIKGDSNYIDGLIRRLGVQLEEQREVRVNIEDSHSALDEINTEIQTAQSELHSATRFGDTVLHLLITEEHNELALKVFQCDPSLLKARNNMLETPLYCAAKVGNKDVIDELIKSDCAAVKNVLTETNKNGHTALHAAIIKGYTEIVQTMLKVDRNLACTPFSDGMFPIHEAARMGHLDMIMHFMQKYPDDAELRDPSGRNLFHIAVEQNEQEFFNIAAMEEKFKEIEGEDDLRLQQWREMIKRMITAKNYEGNTPFHIAAMEGKTDIMRDIWEHYKDEETGERMITAKNHEGNTPFHIAAMKGNRKIMKAIWKHYKDEKTGHTPFEFANKQGYTPLELSAKQVLKTNKDIDNGMIETYQESKGKIFSKKWFNDFMEPPLKDKWIRTQVIGLGSVLITTVTFAAAFTIPGGYNQDDGTPILGRKYMFRAFILANAFAFIQGFLSLFALLFETLRGLSDNAIVFATMSFLVAAGSMVVAFGLGMYVILASVCLPIAILLLVITLFLGTPAVIPVVKGLNWILGPTMNSSRVAGIFYLLIFYVISFLVIFCVAFV
ncbi:uncharacterized protein LOC144545121 [Carex rostrata]